MLKHSRTLTLAHVEIDRRPQSCVLLCASKKGDKHVSGVCTRDGARRLAWRTFHDGALLLHQLRIVQGDGDVSLAVGVASSAAATPCAAGAAVTPAASAADAALALLLPAKQRGSAQPEARQGVGKESEGANEEHEQLARASPYSSDRR